MRVPDLTLVGGALAVCGGVGHLGASLMMRRGVWRGVAEDGYFNTVTLRPTPDQLPAAEAFWFGPGSFGAPLAVLGGLVTHLARRKQRVPRWVGAGISAWALSSGSLSGFLDAGTVILFTTGALLVAGDFQHRGRCGRP